MTYARGLLLALALSLGACTTAHPRLAEPAPTARAEWAPWLLQASQEATAGNYAVADKLLTDYGTRYPASPEAAEAMYWRALFKMDPSNPVSAPRDAAVLLDGYLASGTTTHRVEAQTLRRVASSMETQVHPVATTTTKTDVVKVDDKARDDELARLREELSRANAELERIKRRLAQPKP
jgi:outer membrane protein assembly factor BamD (BamD/ComL family)